MISRAVIALWFMFGGSGGDISIELGVLVLQLVCG